MISIEDAVAAIGLPTDKWHGQCYGVATAIRDAGLVADAIPIYGSYFGAICPEGHWAGKEDYSETYGVHHGWLSDEDGWIIDPTRWSFENVEPYIAVIGPDDRRYQEYDPGSNRMRMESVGHKCPEAELGRLITLNASGDAEVVIDGLIEVQGDGQYTINQVFWLANLTPALYGGQATAVYDALIDAGFAALIPIDNRNMYATAQVKGG